MSGLGNCTIRHWHCRVPPAARDRLYLLVALAGPVRPGLLSGPGGPSLVQLQKNAARKNASMMNFACFMIKHFMVMNEKLVVHSCGMQRVLIQICIKPSRQFQPGVRDWAYHSLEIRNVRMGDYFPVNLTNMHSKQTCIPDLNFPSNKNK